MNNFDVIQKQFGILAIHPLPQTQNFVLNRKNVAILFLLSLQIISVFLFFAIEASNYDEYYGSLFFSMTSLTTVFCYLTFTWQRNDVFTLIAELNEFARTRKIHYIPRKWNFLFLRCSCKLLVWFSFAVLFGVSYE